MSRIAATLVLSVFLVVSGLAQAEPTGCGEITFNNGIPTQLCDNDAVLESAIEDGIAPEPECETCGCPDPTATATPTNTPTLSPTLFTTPIVTSSATPTQSPTATPTVSTTGLPGTPSDTPTPIAVPPTATPSETAGPVAMIFESVMNFLVAPAYADDESDVIESRKKSITGTVGYLVISSEGPGFALVAKDHLAEIVEEDGKKRINYKFDLSQDFAAEVTIKSKPDDKECKTGFPVKFKVTQADLTSLSPGKANWAAEKAADQHQTYYVKVEVTVGNGKEYVAISLTELKAIIDGVVALHELKYSVTKIQFKDRTAAGTYDELQFFATKKVDNVVKTYRTYLSSEEANAGHARFTIEGYLKDRMTEVP